MLLLNPGRFGGGGGPPFLPTDLTNLAAWWDFDDLSSLTVSATLIQVASDLSANSNQLLQNTSGSRPVSVLTAGMNLARFDGSNDFMVASTHSALNWGTASAALFIVYKSNDPDNGALVSKGNNPAAPRYHVRVDGAAGDMIINVNDNIGGGDDFIIDGTEDWTDGTLRLMTCVLERATSNEWKIYANGVETASSGVAVTTADLDNSQHVYVGTQHQGVTFPFNGDIGEIVMVVGTLPGTELSDMNSSLISKWGI